MALDVFMCGDADPERVLEALREAGLGEMDYKVISRPFMEHE
jgi:S-adenosylmethionine/arginine decarboxylase-like enzyme